MVHPQVAKILFEKQRLRVISMLDNLTFFRNGFNDQNKIFVALLQNLRELFAF